MPPLATDRCLLIFDPHEDVAWVKAVLDAERGRCTHVLLGGDYFDTLRSEWGLQSTRAMAQLLRELRADLGPALTVLLGNHDISYLEAWHSLELKLPIPPLRYHAAGFSTDRAAVIHTELDAEFWQQTRLVALVNGWLISHAGVAGRFWRHDLSPQDAFTALEQHAALALSKVPEHYFSLLGCGAARGGREPLGGVTWLDFNFEFDDAEVPLPQIVGHTQSTNGAKQSGRSWCLDGAQSCYGVLTGDGRLEVHTLGTVVASQ